MKCPNKIKDALIYGDYNRIAMMCDCSMVYVRYIVCGYREIKSNKSRQVFEAAKKIADRNRKDFAKTTKA